MDATSVGLELPSVRGRAIGAKYDRRRPPARVAGVPAGGQALRAQRADGWRTAGGGYAIPDAEAKPTIDLPAGANAAVSVFALGFSPPGGSRGWSGAAPPQPAPVVAHVMDLVDDRALVTESFTIKRKGSSACARFGRVARVLTERHQERRGQTLEQPRPSGPRGRRAALPAPKPRPATLHDLILRGHDGSKRIASLREATPRPARTPLGGQGSGIVRSPFGAGWRWWSRRGRRVPGEPHDDDPLFGAAWRRLEVMRPARTSPPVGAWVRLRGS
jgi:hypothetical protein